MKPDIGLNTSTTGVRRDLLVIEVKSPKIKCTAMEIYKLAFEMQCMLNVLIEQNVPKPRTFGILVQGKLHEQSRRDYTKKLRGNGGKCPTYKMDLAYDGVYRMIQLHEFHLPKSQSNFGIVRSAIRILS